MKKTPTTNRTKSKKSRKKVTILIVIVSLLITSSVFITLKNVKEPKEVTIDYSEVFVKLSGSENENIDKVLVYPNNHKVSLYDYKNNVIYVADMSSVEVFMEEYNNTKKPEGIKLDYEYKEETSTVSLILTFMSSAIPMFFIVYMLIMIRHMFKNNNIMQKITGEEKIYPVNTSRYSFKDVAGIDDELWEVQEVVKMLKEPEKYRLTGAKIPKGILLSGEPGTGKTLIAKAIAGESGCRFYECSGSNFDNKYVGVGASKVRTLFNEARKNAPAIVFIDEIDAIGRKRYSSESSSEQTLNQLLTEMDGFNETNNVIVIAATNFIEVLDSAITRPGRFDRIINIPLPDCKGREEILKVHARDKKFENEAEKARLLKDLAKKTSGMSGATLENILNESAIIAVRNNREYISEEDISEAFIRIIVGISKHDKEVSESQKRLVAIHESGHAIASRIKRPDVEILQASIIPRGNAGGYTLFADKNENDISRKDALISDIIVHLGGRAAEQAYFSSISVGASSDLKKANKLAHKMVYAYAMGKKSQLVQIYEEKDYNRQLESNMFSDVEDIVNSAYDEAVKIMQENKELLQELSDGLMEKPTLNSEELEEIFSKHLGYC